MSSNWKKEPKLSFLKFLSTSYSTNKLHSLNKTSKANLINRPWKFYNKYILFSIIVAMHVNIYMEIFITGVRVGFVVTKQTLSI